MSQKPSALASSVIPASDAPNFPVVINGTTTVGGAAAHDAAIAGNPIRIAARAITSAYTGVASNDTADLVCTPQGVLITRGNAIPELQWSFASAAGGITGTADVVLAGAAGAGIRRYLTGLTLSNSSATGTEVVIKDGSTVIWRDFVRGNSGTFAVPLADAIRSTANTALNIACLTAGAAVYANAQGYTAQ